jgi:hypothetical protein
LSASSLESRPALQSLSFSCCSSISSWSSRKTSVAAWPKRLLISAKSEAAIYCDNYMIAVSISLGEVVPRRNFGDERATLCEEAEGCSRHVKASVLAAFSACGRTAPTPHGLNPRHDHSILYSIAKSSSLGYAPRVHFCDLARSVHHTRYYFAENTIGVIEVESSRSDLTKSVSSGLSLVRELTPRNNCALICDATKVQSTI